MASNTNQKGRRKTSPFIMLRTDIYDHPAWQALSTNARCIYLEIRRRYNGQNNGHISLSVREAAIVCQSSKSTAQNALKLLQAHGFITKAHIGMFTYRKATTWQLNCEATSNQAPSNDWRNWTPQI